MMETDTSNHLKETNVDPQRVLGIFALAMINVAAVLTISNFPPMAELGWSCIGWYIIGTIIFLIPLSLAVAELATMLSDRGGGVYTWCREAFGTKSGFVAVYCVWSTNLVWFPTGLAFIASTLAFAFSPALGMNPVYLFAVMMIAFWGTTEIAYFGEGVSSKFQNYGAILGMRVWYLSI
jgi:amino acid transporter